MYRFTDIISGKLVLSSKAETIMVKHATLQSQPLHILSKL